MGHDNGHGTGLFRLFVFLISSLAAVTGETALAQDVTTPVTVTQDGNGIPSLAPTPMLPSPPEIVKLPSTTADSPQPLPDNTQALHDAMARSVEGMGEPPPEGEKAEAFPEGTSLGGTVLDPRAQEARSAIAQTEDAQAAQTETEEPVAARLLIAPGLEEPLVAVKATSAEEDRDIKAAVEAFRRGPSDKAADAIDHYQPLTAYMARHPGSGWNAAIKVNLGNAWYRQGYFSRAFTAWEEAWKEGRDATGVQAKALVDRAVGELARMHARVGHAEALDKLFAEMGTRPMTGAATEMVTGAREGLWAFRHNPGIAYLCGPKALGNVLRAQGGSREAIAVTDAARSGPHGFSLQQVGELAAKAGVKHRLVKREPGQPIPVPSVVNWKVNHYAAITAERNGKYLVKDPTFASGDLLMTAEAIDAESSGFFLVPEGAEAKGGTTGAAPWRDATSAEAAAVYGMGYSQDGDLSATDAGQIKLSSCGDQRGMCGANAHMMLVSLNLTDMPVGKAPQKGPSTAFVLTYNHREASQPANFSFGNVGQKWTHNWIGYIEDDPQDLYGPMRVVLRGGGSRNYDFNAFRSGGELGEVGGSTHEMQGSAWLKRIPTATDYQSYERRFRDGSKEVYALSDGAAVAPRRFYLTQIVDRAGNAVSLGYDAQFRVTTLTDASGRVTSLAYGLAGSPLLVTKVTDPFGRAATLTYDASGRLKSIKDAIGITSSFAYGADGPVASMTTPYGVTNFAYDESFTGDLNFRSLEIRDPLGFSERVEYRMDDLSIPEAATPQGMNNSDSPLYFRFRNTLYWDRNVYPTDHAAAAKAKLYHWLHLATERTLAAPVPESVKNPLEGRVYYSYPWYDVAATGGYDKPDFVGRVLDDGSTQLRAFTYDLYNTGNYNLGTGSLTSATDPLGRSSFIDYDANGIDPVAWRQKTDAGGGTTTVAQYTWNAQHRPLTQVDAAGKTWIYEWNAAGQMTAVTDPLNRVTRYDYDTTGRLTKITNANNATQVSFTYDAQDRVATRTDSQGHKLTYAYDALDRVTKVTYPDGSNVSFDYKFQSGPKAGTPSLDLRKVTDRLGRVTLYDYDANRRLISITDPLNRVTRFGYFPNGALKTLTDAKGNVTTWDVDIQSRVTKKTYPDGRFETYTYENTTSRLKSITDALGQKKTFAWNLDDTIKSVTYTNAVNATPNVSFTWDPFWPRRTKMVDGTGTTLWTYKAVNLAGALQLASENGPLANDTVTLSYNAAGLPVGRSVNGVNESFGHDKLDRLTSHGTGLGTFAYAYLGQTGQTASRSVTNGATVVSTAYAYDSNANDRRLKTITNSGPSRSYALTTDRANRILALNETPGAGSPWSARSWTYTYDDADRLKTAVASGANHSWSYDDADNITTRTDAWGTRAATFNANNQITVAGGKSYVYDANGNVTDDGTRTYKWDAENRIIRITDKAVPSRIVTFAYDGLGRRKSIGNGTATTAIEIWCPMQEAAPCERRSAANAPIRRFYPEGELQIDAGNRKLVYQQDQIGSTRDTIDAATGALAHSFDFDAWGNAMLASGATPPTARYAGMVYEPTFGLYLTRFRVFDPRTGTWLSRDPYEEGGSPSGNLYPYGNNNPVSNVDLLGLRSTINANGTITITPGDLSAPTVTIGPIVGAHGVAPTDANFHHYNVPTTSSGACDLASVGHELINSPTPGPGNSPASPGGTVNDAGQIGRWPIVHPHNYVVSFVVPSTNPNQTDAVVNYTISGGHFLEEGFVIRWGTIGNDGSITLRSYGEGNGWGQTPALTFYWQGIVEKTWGDNQSAIFRGSGCSCR